MHTLYERNWGLDEGLLGVQRQLRPRQACGISGRGLHAACSRRHRCVEEYRAASFYDFLYYLTETLNKRIVLVFMFCYLLSLLRFVLRT